MYCIALTQNNHYINKSLKQEKSMTRTVTKSGQRENRESDFQSSHIMSSTISSFQPDIIKYTEETVKYVAYT